MIALLLALSIVSAEPPAVTVLPPGACVQEATFALTRPGAEAVALCFRERDRLKAALAECPVVVEPPLKVERGAPWWLVPAGVGVGLLGGVLLGGWVAEH